jgi:hypothetical protein
LQADDRSAQMHPRPGRATRLNSSRRLAPNRNDVRNLCSRSVPLVVALERQAELVVVDAQITIPAARDSLWHDLLHLLGDHTDIGFVAAVIAEAVEAKAVAEMAEQDNVVLQPDVGSPSTATAGTAAATRGAATAVSNASARPCALRSAAAARSMGGLRPLPARGSRSGARPRALRGATPARPLGGMLPLPARRSRSRGRPPVAGDRTRAISRTVLASEIAMAAAGFDDLLAAAAAEIEPLLPAASVAGALSMLDTGLPVPARVGDRIRRPVDRDVPVIPVYAAAPIVAARGPAS